jgi:Protein of unknown function (DUF4238)
MPPAPAIAQPRGRLDHLLPQGYLEGFTNPSTPGRLSVFGIERQQWFESTPRKVAAINGFYDYSPDSAPDQTADQAFKEFEERFPNIRRELVANRFSGWQSHLEFLLRYAQMLRSRSELFRKQTVTNARQKRMVRVKEVFNDPASGKTSIKYEELTETAEEREKFFRNMAITTMRLEIAKGAAFFSQLHWCLRIATAVTDPVITGDDAVVVEGKVPTLEAALTDADTLIFFPVCRHACLIGSPAKFDLETEAFHASDVKLLQSRYLKGECRFAYSPKRLDATK